MRLKTKDRQHAAYTRNELIPIYRMKRRTFLKSGLILSVGFPCLSSCRFPSGEKAGSDRLFALFQNPPADSKPFVRWWWNGNRLSEKEIFRQLDVMKAAGIGGVEINSIAFPEEADPMGIPALAWLSPEWIAMVKTALKGAEERTMICDIIVGSGWPFGGKFLEKEERTQLLTLASRKVKGGGRIQWATKQILEEASPVIHSNYNRPYKEIEAVYLAPLHMETFTPPVEVPIDNRAADLLDISVPEGEYILYVLVKVTGFQAVINGAPGADGPVLNHYNRTAVTKFLNCMSDALFPALAGMKGFRALFCDSMELEGANWNADFPETFKARKGYDLRPYLPFILYKVGHMGQAVESAEITRTEGQAKEEIARARYDFQTFCIEMIRERFLLPYTEWCRQHGVQSRVQPYGREFHPLDASLEVDIPECETWLWNPDRPAERNFAKDPAYSNVNKFVSSAAHLMGKRLISCEEITNTGMVFNATLERIKIAGDQSNLSGVTHSILHGFNYSPREADFPGWIRYGTYFSERNPWWPFFASWSAYKARISSVLQHTDYFAEIAVIHPLADLWTKYGTQRDPFPALHYPAYQYKIWEAIHQSGHSCDYISESILRQAESSGGRLRFNGRRYHTLILLKVETIAPETAEALENFAREGGKILFVENEPCRASGLQGYRERDKQVASRIASLKKDYPETIYRVEAPEDNVLDWFLGVQRQCKLTPYLHIDRPRPFVSQIRHQGEGKDIYFICNYSTDETATLRIGFPECGKKAWLWNPETGQREAVTENPAYTLTLVLPPATSKLVVYEDAGPGYPENRLPASTATNPAPVELTEWEIEMQPIEGNKFSLETHRLQDWSLDPATRSFAGQIVYRARLENNAGAHVLDLGKVYGVSEAIVNGEKLGARWYGRHRYPIPGHLQKAERLAVEIRILTTAGNFLKSATGNRTAQAWTAQQDWQPAGMIGPVLLS